MAKDVEAASLLRLSAAIKWTAAKTLPMLVRWQNAPQATSRFRSADAVQVLGCVGYTLAFEVEHLYRDAKITQIDESTDQIQLMMICHELIKHCARG